MLVDHDGSRLDALLCRWEAAGEVVAPGRPHCIDIKFPGWAIRALRRCLALSRVQFDMPLMI